MQKAKSAPKIKPGPTELLPHLLIGGATDVRNQALMAELKVKFIINVARELDTLSTAGKWQLA